jgi:hypothetical protein
MVRGKHHNVHESESGERKTGINFQRIIDTGLHPPSGIFAPPIRGMDGPEKIREKMHQTRYVGI